VKNEVTESAVANLLFLIQGTWVTPPISAGVLPGVIRAIAIEECDVKVRPIHISEIPDVESAFSLASLRIAQPISHIGEMKLKIGDASEDMEARIRSHTQPHSVG
jgi:branched-subunit amino acid aminotransferase/4-amino-4-deoxychorismate lyase